MKIEMHNSYLLVAQNCFFFWYHHLYNYYFIIFHHLFKFNNINQVNLVPFKHFFTSNVHEFAFISTESVYFCITHLSSLVRYVYARLLSFYFPFDMFHHATDLQMSFLTKI